MIDYPTTVEKEDRMREIVSIFSDGGCCRTNPSPIGGTWSYVAVGAEDAVIREAYGSILPGDIGLEKVSNNVSELFGAMHALESLPAGWEGTLFTDSLITLRRVVYPHAKFNGVPEGLRERLKAARRLLSREMKVRLLSGHPTRAHLACGIGKRGTPCSKHNVRADLLCQRAAEMLAAGNVVSLVTEYPCE